jgi:8-oxo-dGTP diphosphatase
VGRPEGRESRPPVDLGIYDHPVPEAAERQRVAAYGVARRGQEVLLVRAASVSGVPGTWWLPGGGVRFGESPAECLVREFVEETGLTARVQTLLDVVSDVGMLAGEPVRLHSVRVVYVVGVDDGPVRPEVDGSTDAVRWVPIPELADLTLAPWLEKVARAHLIAG